MMMSELKNTLHAINHKSDITKENISELENSKRNNPKSNTEREKDIIKLLSNSRWPNAYKIGVPTERRGRARKKILKK